MLKKLLNTIFRPQQARIKAESEPARTIKPQARAYEPTSSEASSASAAKVKETAPQPQDLWHGQHDTPTTADKTSGFRPIFDDEGLSSCPVRLDIRSGYVLDAKQKRMCRERIQSLEQDATIEFWLATRIQVNKTCQTLKRSKTQWHRDLAAVSNYLAVRLEAELASSSPQFELDNQQTKIVATLAYFADMDDVIPDHILGKGYSDDAYVMNECIKALKRNTKWADNFSDGGEKNGDC